MSINYQLFDFACPPRTGTAWVTKAAQLVGLGLGFRCRAHMPFGEKKEDSPVRVSLVRHPCDWLVSCFAALKSDELKTNHLSVLSEFPTESFGEFIETYLTHPGFVGGTYNRYEADVCLRIEDMPWAFMELLDSLGVPKALRQRCKDLKAQNVSKDKPQFSGYLRSSVLIAEEEIVEAYEYC